MLKFSITIVLTKTEVELPIRGRGRKVTKMAESSMELETKPEIKKVENTPFSLIPERNRKKVENTKPRVSQFEAQPNENEYLITPPEVVVQNFLNAEVTGEEVWSFIRTFKNSMRWSGELIFTATFKKMIASLSPSQVFYFFKHVRNKRIQFFSSLGRT